MAGAAWKVYQEQAALVFRGLGIEAATDEVMEGTRAKHDIDVVVRPRWSGIDQLWVVECKLWNRPVGKEPVLALAGVVANVGADRGFLLSESGFQPAAIHSAYATNITLTSLGGLREKTKHEAVRFHARVLLRMLEVEELMIMRFLLEPSKLPAEPVRPGVNDSVLIKVIDRIQNARRRLAYALAGVLPTATEADEESVLTESLAEAAGEARSVIRWVNEQIERQLNSVEVRVSTAKALEE